MKSVDLHVHSNYSDGTFTPEQLVRYAFEKKLSAFALTDHDTVEGIEKAIKESIKFDVEIVPGVEISSKYCDNELHIVGLFIDYNSSSLRFQLEELKKRRLERNINLLKRLNALGFDITWEYLLSQSGGKIITRAHFARALVSKGYAQDYQECFSKYLSKGRPAYIERVLPSAKEAIDMIRSAGGAAVLAHPLLYKLSEEQLCKALCRLKDAGMVGVECYYSTHTQSETDYLLDLIKKYDLKPSGGSDFHGANKPKIDLGIGMNNLNIAYEVLTQLKEGLED